MPTYSAQDRLAAAQKAGFPDPLTAVSVSLAEFGANRDINVQSQSDIVSNGVREPSFGPWQIHLPSHPNVTQSCAMDLTCSTHEAFKISNGGTDFSPWSAFTNGSYKAELTKLVEPFKAIATSAPTPSVSGGGGSTAASASNCRDLNVFEMVEIVNEHNGGAGRTLEDIAARWGMDVACIQSNAQRFYGVAGNVPGVTGTEGASKAVQGAVSGATTGISKFTDLLKPENLWRAGFVIVGVGAVFIGGRMYLRDSEAPVVREGVSG